MRSLRLAFCLAQYNEIINVTHKFEFLLMQCDIKWL